MAPRPPPPARARPARGAGDGEQDGKHVHGEPHRLVDDAGVEVYVRVELALDEVVVFEGDALKLQGDVQERVATGDAEHFVGGAFDDPGAGVVAPVDAGAEAHETAFAGLDPLDELRHTLPVADLGEHADDGLVGAAVQRSVEGGGRGGRGRERVGAAGG